MVFQQLGRRVVVRRFDGGKISSDAGGVILREVENALVYLIGCRMFSIIATRIGSNTRCVTHPPASLWDRTGYEDLNDHDSLRHDVMMGLLSEKTTQWNRSTERTRPRQADRGQKHVQSTGADA